MKYKLVIFKNKQIKNIFNYEAFLDNIKSNYRHLFSSTLTKGNLEEIPSLSEARKIKNMWKLHKHEKGSGILKIINYEN